MPTYGYRCQSCSDEFELLQRMSDPPEAACPACGGAGRRLFYPAGILFKGSGFYKTDSRPSESSKAASNGGAAGDGPAKSSDGAAGDTKKPATAPAASSDKAKPATTTDSGAKPSASSSPSAPASPSSPPSSNR